MAIFLDHVDHYITSGLPAIPLIRRDKRPAITNWSRFCASMPEPVELQRWKEIYAEGNIGLPLGTASGLCMIDIDVEDPSLIQKIIEALPPSPWHRRGKKGLVLAYKHTGINNFVIKDSNGRGMLDFLSAGRQVVLPPSIHPDTKEPYTSNSNLWEVFGECIGLNTEVEALLRGVFEEHGIKLSTSGHSKLTDWVASGARDTTMIEKAGMLAFSIRRGENTLKEALAHLRVWGDMCVDKVVGDPVDIDKGIERIVQFLRRDVLEEDRLLPEGWAEGFSDDELTEMGLDFGVDRESWNVDTMLDYLQEQFMENPVKTHRQGRMKAVEEVLKRLAAQPDTSDLDEDMVINFIKDTGGLSLTLGALRRRLAQYKSNDNIDGNDQSEIALALKEDMEQVSEVRYHNSEFYQWRGSHWDKVEQTDIRRRISENYGSLPAARKAGDHKGIVQILADRCAGELKTNKDIIGVNFANGVVTLDGALVPHNKEFGFTYTLPYRYMPDEARRATRFMQFLEDSWGHEEDYEDRVSALQEAICTTLFGIAPRYQRAFLLYGAPKCGKSVLLDVISDLLPPEGTCSVSPENWSDRFLPAQMANKSLNICGELSSNDKIKAQQFKEIVAGAEITAQNKGKDPFRYRVQCAHWFASNHLPKTDDSSDAFNRRWLVLFFNKPVDMKNIDRSLALKIVTEEREAIAAWAIQARERIQQNKEYTLPQSHVDLIQEVAISNNSVRFFIEESGQVTVDPKKTSHLTSATTLHSAFSAFCMLGGGAKRVGPIAFRGAMRELEAQLGFKSKKIENANGQRDIGYIGVTLVTNPAG